MTSVEHAERLTSVFHSFVAWAKSGDKPDTTWIITREEAGRVVAEIEWGYREAERATDLATELDAMRESKQRLHRRAQKAESDLAKVPTFQVLQEALEDLQKCRTERHQLRNDKAFMAAERRRLKARIRELEVPRG